MTDYILTRSKRKTIAIHVTKDAAVEVRADESVRSGDRPFRHVQVGVD